MNYRVVYDVLDDVALPSHTAALVFLGGEVFFTVTWVVLTYVIRKRSPENGVRMGPGVVVGGLLICLGVLQVVSGTYPAYLDEERRKAWARAGQHETVVGTVTRFRRDNARYPPTHFQLGDFRFTYQSYEPKTSGFKGDFTAPGTETLKLRDGLRVHIVN